MIKKYKNKKTHLNFVLGQIDILNLIICIDLVLDNLYDKNFRKFYFGDNLFDLTFDLKMLKSRLNTAGNSYFYNDPNNDYFVFLEKYMLSKDKDYRSLIKEYKEPKIKKLSKTYIKNLDVINNQYILYLLYRNKNKCFKYVTK